MFTTSNYIGQTDTCGVTIVRYEVFTVVVLKVTDSCTTIFAAGQKDNDAS
jgi:hypothetical protein